MQGYVAQLQSNLVPQDTPRPLGNIHLLNNLTTLPLPRVYNEKRECVRPTLLWRDSAWSIIFTNSVVVNDIHSV